MELLWSLEVGIWGFSRLAGKRLRHDRCWRARFWHCVKLPASGREHQRGFVAAVQGTKLLRDRQRQTSSSFWPRSKRCLENCGEIRNFVADYLGRPRFSDGVRSADSEARHSVPRSAHGWDSLATIG